jgi:hypothetical protein
MATHAHAARTLPRFAWMSALAALLTIGLKTWAWELTGSVGLLSDALESLVNLAGAMLAIAMLTVAARPEDDDHPYGHDKAEYFSSGAEGALILIAALGMAFAAVRRLLAPHPLEQLGVGLAVSSLAAVVNLGVARSSDGRAATRFGDARGPPSTCSRTCGRRREFSPGSVSSRCRARSGSTGGRAAGVREHRVDRAGDRAPRRHRAHGQRCRPQSSALQRRWPASRAGARALAPVGRAPVRDPCVLVAAGGASSAGTSAGIEADIRRAIPSAGVLTHLESLDDPASWDDIPLDAASRRPRRQPCLPLLRSPPHARLLATAVPPRRACRRGARLVARMFAGSGGGARGSWVFDHSGIAQRHICMPLEWYLSDRSFAEQRAT